MPTIFELDLDSNDHVEVEPSSASEDRDEEHEAIKRENTILKQQIEIQAEQITNLTKELNRLKSSDLVNFVLNDA